MNFLDQNKGRGSVSSSTTTKYQNRIIILTIVVVVVVDKVINFRASFLSIISSTADVATKIHTNSM